MNDKEYAKQKKRVEKYINKWHRVMGLGWFCIEYIWDREHKEDSPNTAALTNSAWQYKDASITWFLPQIQALADDRLENIVVHEFCHVLLSGLAQWIEDNPQADQLNEYTTELVANAMIWSREAGEEKNERQN